MKKNKTVKVFAILGLLGIIVSVVGTGILVLTSPTETQTYEINNQELTSEDLQKIIDDNKIEVKAGTGEIK